MELSRKGPGLLLRDIRKGEDPQVAAVVRLLADRLMVMKDGHVVETGLTDQVLDDPQHGYTQLLVSSVLQV